MSQGTSDPAPNAGSEGRQLLSGWGRTAPSAGTVLAPSDVHALEELVAAPRPRGCPSSAVIARGLGRSYGDAAQCAGGVVINTARFSTIGPIDITGTVEVGAGVSLDDLISVSLPAGWLIAVTPGTRQVTVGGAIAADVHGKNHHCDGSFCSYVTSLTLVTPAGTHTVSAESDPELFWATAGGMGLTGVIVKATLQLKPVETAWLEVDTERFDDLDATMTAMRDTDDGYRYSVAWLDCTRRGTHLGRSVVTWGNHAPKDALSPGMHEHALKPPGKPRLRVPFMPPGGPVNPVTMRVFNEMWFRKAPRIRRRSLESLSSFFHPLDAVADWNLLYGKGGFVQHQLVVPQQHADVIGTAVGMMAESGIPSSMAVLKRFGPGDPGPLSFPIEGWTLALDFPAKLPGLPDLLDRLDVLVADAGGRIYLAKDSRLRPELLHTMYPRLGDLEAVRDRVDPDRVLQSDLSRRLDIGRRCAA
ncbi:MAG TPA: FAD-binding oxidoreductase [Acidimicrobiales bacterium]|nr:FAD-binding oxidoreductase [Acidimicrobiales bacterium]